LALGALIVMVPAYNPGARFDGSALRVTKPGVVPPCGATDSHDPALFAAAM
jgi:hypothetical protein